MKINVSRACNFTFMNLITLAIGSCKVWSERKENSWKTPEKPVSVREYKCKSILESNEDNIFIQGKLLTLLSFSTTNWHLPLALAICLYKD